MKQILSLRMTLVTTLSRICFVMAASMYAYHFSGYWKDVGTISSLWEANMEVLDPEHSGINLFR